MRCNYFVRYKNCATKAFVPISLLPSLEPPSPPRNVMAEGISPQSITVTFLPPLIWNSLTEISYNLTYQPVDSDNISFILFGSTVQHNMEGMEERPIEGLRENTEYIIAVSAVNEIGSSLPSMPITASTKAFMSEFASFVAWAV